MSAWCFLGSAGEGNDDYELLQTVPLVEGIIGSDRSCEVRLRDPLITPRHARLLKRDDAWFIGGVAAMSPTLVNGVATLPGEAVQLAVGDVVELANTRFRFGGEPPTREGVDANNEAAALMYADALAERGSPVGLRILEKQPPSPSWLAGLESFVDGGVLEPEWTRGLLTAVEVRETPLSALRRLLENEAAVALERLTVHLSTCGEGSEQERVRTLLQLLAVTTPPRLRQLRLGLLHAPLLPAPSRDWTAVARRIPLEGTLPETCGEAGQMRFIMLRSGAGMPEVGAVTVVSPESLRLLLAVGEPLRHPVVVAGPGSGATFVTAEEFTLNGRASWNERRLIHGDSIEAETFAFRFEEDPQ